MKNLKYQRQQFSMLSSVCNFVFKPENETILNSFIPFREACESLNTKVESLRKKIALNSRLIAYNSQQKHNARIQLAETGFAIMSTVRSFCVKNQLPNIAEQLKFTVKALKAMPCMELLQRSMLAIREIEPLVPQLTDYHIDNDAIEQWKNRHSAFDQLLMAPKAAIKIRHVVDLEIVHETAAILLFFRSQVIPLVAHFYLTNHLFYKNIHSLKRIGLPNTHHTRIKAKVVSELDAPYYGATVRVDAFTDPKTGKTYEAVSAVTDFNGDAEVSGFHPSYRTVTISGPGIKTTTFPPIIFRKAKAIQKTFVCAPSFANLPEAKKQTAPPNNLNTSAHS